MKNHLLKKGHARRWFAADEPRLGALSALAATHQQRSAPSVFSVAATIAAVVGLHV
jgi:hypothetical protein